MNNAELEELKVRNTRNTRIYSDSSFWYLRGIEDDHSFTSPPRYGDIIEDNLKFTSENSQIFIKPQSIVFLGTDKNLTAIFSLDFPNYIFLFTGSDYRFFAIIDFCDHLIIDICNIEHDIYLLTDKNKILLISLIVTDLNNQVKNHDNSNILKFKYKKFKNREFSIAAFNSNVNTRIIAWQTSGLTFKILAWQLNSSELYLSEPKNDNAVFRKTSLCLSTNILQSMRISKCYYHKYSSSVYLTDNGGGRVLLLYLSEKRLRAKIIIGDGHKQFKMGKAETARFISPYGITVFDLHEHKSLSSAFGFSGKNMDFKNSFLIVLDQESKLAVTVHISNEKKFDREVEILPLLGKFPDTNLKNSSSNLARYEIDFAKNITKGTNGCLLFWCEGNSSIYILNPRFNEIIENSKRVYSTLKQSPTS